jgi:endoglucanase
MSSAALAKSRLFNGLPVLWLLMAACGCGNGTMAYPEQVPVDTTKKTELASKELPWLHIDGNLLKNQAGEVVILRGVSTVDLGTTNGYPGHALGMIDRLTNKVDTQGSSPGWYTTVIRLAIYPADSTDTKSPFTYNPNDESFYQQLLRPVVDRCRKRGAYAIIDWHYIGDTDQHRETTTQFWADMAPRFKDDSHVLFELFNEPVNKTSSNPDGDWASVRADMQDWYNTIRASAPDNLVLVGTPSWCQLLGDTADSPIDGTNVAYVSHVYPMHFVWSAVLDGIRKAKANNPVFMTEWGFQGDATNKIVNGTATDYGEPFRQFVDELGLSWTAWCASYNWYPPMFDSGFNLLVGEGSMGGFAKDWLYEARDINPPVPFVE